MPSWEDAVVTLVSAESGSRAFGTAFVVAREGDKTYLITCHHVLKDIGIEQTRVWPLSDEPVELVAEGDDELDLAIISIRGLLDLPCLPIGVGGAKQQSIQICGYSLVNDRREACTLPARLGSRRTIQWEREGQKVYGWHLHVGNTDEPATLADGYSGSPLYDSATGCAIGVTTHRKNAGKGLGIDLAGVTLLHAASKRWFKASSTQTTPPVFPDGEDLSDHWIVSTINRERQFTRMQVACDDGSYRDKPWSVFLYEGMSEDMPHLLAERVWRQRVERGKTTTAGPDRLRLNGGRDAFLKALLKSFTSELSESDSREDQLSELRSWLALGGDKVFYATLKLTNSRRELCDVLSGACETLEELQCGDSAASHIMVMLGCVRDAQKQPWWRRSPQLPTCPQLPGEAHLEPLSEISRSDIDEWLNDDPTWRKLPLDFDTEKLRESLFGLFDSNGESLRYRHIRKYLITDGALNKAYRGKR